jgi:glycosyltransferase involved in cell wall biosynthesis
MPKFSVVTPVTYDKEGVDNLRMPRYEMFLRCIGSIESQTYKDFEWVVADDMSNPPVDSLKKFPDVGKIVRLPEKSGRIFARNAGMREAKGDWICWLDADDEYASWYLEALNDAIRIYPEYQVFNFNHLIFSYNYGISIRKFMNMEEWGDKPFPSGMVGAGSYVFSRRVFEEIGLLPELGLWDFAEQAFKDHPEIKQFFEKKDESGHPTGQFNSLGNPWGEDYLYWYKITRKFKSKYLDTAPYFVHSRWGHRWSDDPDYTVDPGAKPEWNKNNQ